MARIKCNNDSNFFEVCTEKFLNKDISIKILWVLLIGFASVLSIAGKWAFSETKLVTQLEMTVESHEKKINEFDKINYKLDTLILLAKERNKNGH
jgi:hypothetical protein